MENKIKFAFSSEILVNFRTALVTRTSIQSPFGILKRQNILQLFQNEKPLELLTVKMDNEFYKECLLIEYAAYYRKHNILAG